MHVSSRVKSVGRREAEGNLRGWRTHVRVFAADGEARSVGHAVKLGPIIGRCDGWMGLMGSSNQILPTLPTLRPKRDRERMDLILLTAVRTRTHGVVERLR